MPTVFIIICIAIVIIAAIVYITSILPPNWLKYNEEKKQISDSEEYYEEQNNREQTPKYPYHFKYLLTKNEWDFYQKMKVVTDRYNLHIIAKVRLADLVEVDDYLTGNAFNKYFWKIQAKHVDFVLCNPKNLAVIAILELEDGSHNTTERAERDNFVDKVLKKCGYNVIHTYNGSNIEETLRYYGVI